MIGRIKGILERRKPQEILVDVHGIGYSIHIPLSTFYKLPVEGTEVGLEIYTHVREDTLDLFGFLSLSEKHLFQSLISVSKIGPKLAINIMSGAEPGRIANAIKHEDVIFLTSIPGIGKKTAERLVYELRGKEITEALQKGDEGVSNAGTGKGGVIADVISALVNLGYPGAVAEGAVLKAKKHVTEENSVEEMLKESLKYLIKHRD